MKYCDSEAVPYKVSRCCVVTLVTPDHLCYLQSVIKLQVYHCPHLLAAGTISRNLIIGACVPRIRQYYPPAEPCTCAGSGLVSSLLVTPT